MIHIVLPFIVEAQIGGFVFNHIILHIDHDLFFKTSIYMTFAYYD